MISNVIGFHRYLLVELTAGFVTSWRNPWNPTQMWLRGPLSWKPGCCEYGISHTHDGSMVLYMVCHGSHQYSPLMLALIYQHHGSVMGKKSHIWSAIMYLNNFCWFRDSQRCVEPPRLGSQGQNPEQRHQGLGSVVNSWPCHVWRENSKNIYGQIWPNGIK